MNENMTILDFIPKQDKEQFIPEVWRCMETCKNCSNRFPDGGRDYFPETHEPRCINAVFKSKLVNNVWVTRCKNYEWRAPDD